MSRRIAHRPRYRSARQLIQQTPQSSHKAFFRKRWTYRRQEATYEKHPLGYALSFIELDLRRPRAFQAWKEASLPFLTLGGEGSAVFSTVTT